MTTRPAPLIILPSREQGQVRVPDVEGKGKK